MIDTTGPESGTPLVFVHGAGANRGMWKPQVDRLQTEFRNRKNVVFQFLGAGLLGVFVQGFTAEMLAESPQTWAVTVYVVIGFIGLFGVFWSLIR